MLRKYLLPLLAVVGVVFAIWTVVTGSRPVPAAPPVAQPSPPPFASYVAGSGIIEPSTQNIAVGTHVSDFRWSFLGDLILYGAYSLGGVYAIQVLVLLVVLAAVQYMWCPMHRWAEVRRQGAEATALPRETARRWQVVGLAATIGGAAIGASVAAVLAYPPGASGGPVFVVAVAGG